jgi:F-type H+-transporting ATPase subunit b
MLTSASSSGSFLITPNVGLMIWTLVLFGISMYILAKVAFPRISEALDRRQHAIEESIDHADQMRKEADELLADYRERLREARDQADGIIERARKAGEAHERESKEVATEERERLLEQTRREIETETRRAIQEIRNEVADLTVLATEKVTRKSLDEDDQRRLVEDALKELDFSALAADSGGGSE